MKNFVGLGISLCVVLISACSSQTQDDKEPDLRTFSGEETLVAFEDEVLATPGQILVDDERRMFVYDMGHFSVFEFDLEGNQRNKFGREGEGPGEFGRTITLMEDDGFLYAADRSQNRLSKFDDTGKLLDTRNIEFGVMAAGITNLHQGKFLVPGRDNTSLATLFDVDNLEEPITQIGSPPGDMPDVFDLNELRNQASRGDIPPFLMRSAYSAFDDDGYIYINQMATTTLTKFTPKGDTLWSKNLNFPEADRKLDRYKEANSGMDGQTLMMLIYFDRLFVCDDYIHLSSHISNENDEQDVFLFRLDHDGNLLERIEFPNIDFTLSQFVYLPETQSYYAVNRNEASIVRLFK